MLSVKTSELVIRRSSQLLSDCVRHHDLRCRDESSGTAWDTIERCDRLCYLCRQSVIDKRWRHGASVDKAESLLRSGGTLARVFGLYGCSIVALDAIQLVASASSSTYVIEAAHTCRKVQRNDN